MAENTLHTTEGIRKYLTSEEREAFYQAALAAPPKIRTLCHTLHVTGCRVSEALALPFNRVDLVQKSLVLRTLKKHKHPDGREKVIYRVVPVPESYLDMMGIIHHTKQNRKKQPEALLWGWSRQYARRVVKQVMADAGLDTSHPAMTPKGLRHAFGMHGVLSGVPLPELQKLMGHASLETTAIYLNAVGAEKRELVSRMW